MLHNSHSFIEAWPQILSIKQNKSDYRLVVVGGGGAGVELSLAAQYAFTRSDTSGHMDLVVSESGLLIGFATGAQRRIKKILAEAGVSVHYLRAAGTKNGLMLSNGVSLIADCVVATTGAKAPIWLKHSKLMLDKNEYIAVDGLSPKPIASKCICGRRRLLSTRFDNVTLRRSFGSRRTGARRELASSIKKWTNDHLQPASLFTVFAGLWASLCSSLLGKLEHTR